MRGKITVNKIVLLIISILFIGNCIDQIITVNDINDSLIEKNQELVDIKEENKKMQAELERANRDHEYLEDIARERLGLIREGEHIILERETQE